MARASLRSWQDSRPSARALFRANGREREPRSREGMRLRGSLSLPFALNKARALGRESRQLRRLGACEKQEYLKQLLEVFVKVLQIFYTGSAH